MPRGLQASRGSDHVCGRAYSVCASAHIRHKSKCFQRSGTYAPAHTISKQQPGAVRRLKCPSGHAIARMRAGHRRCVRCARPASAGSGTDPRAHYTDTNRNRRRRKGLEPLRRLSKTTGQFDLSAIRVAVPCTEVTNSCRGRNRSERFCTHGAPGPGPFPQRTGAGAHGPHRSGGLRTCSRSTRPGRAFASIQGDGSFFIHAIPGPLTGAGHVFPHRQAMREALQHRCDAKLDGRARTPSHRRETTREWKRRACGVSVGVQQPRGYPVPKWAGQR